MNNLPMTTLDVSGVGVVELPGVGPWRVREVSHSTFDIVDAENRITNPHVTAGYMGRGSRRSMNVVYANKSTPNAIVTAFNATLDKAD